MSLIKRMNLSLENAIAVYKNYGFILQTDAEAIFELFLNSQTVKTPTKNNKYLECLTVTNKELENELGITYNELVKLYNATYFYTLLIIKSKFNLNNIKCKKDRQNVIFLVEIMGKSIHKDSQLEKEKFALIVTKIVTSSRGIEYSVFKTNENICRAYLQKNKLLQNYNNRHKKD